MSQSPRKIFSFTDFTIRTPTAQPPGDRIDAQFAEHAHSIQQLQQNVADLEVKAQTFAQPRYELPPSQTASGSPLSAVLFSANSAENWAQVSWHWAEYLDGPIPADSVAWMGIAGEHWSSRYWATIARNAADEAGEAADVAESFNDYYLGPWPTPPVTDNDGDPLQEGAIYFDTSLDQMRVWNGTAWVSGPATANVAAVDVSSNPSGDVTATNVQFAINELAAEKATIAQLNAAIALPAHASVSDTPPAGSVVGQLWFDSDNGRLFVWFDNFWVQVKGS